MFPLAGIFIISSDPHLRRRVKSLLPPSGHTILGESGDGMQALRQVRGLSPDLILLDADLPGGSLKIAKIIAEDRIAPILLLSSSWSGELIHQARSTWIFSFALKPVTGVNLLPAVESAITSYTHLSRAEERADTLDRALKERKIIEQAKGLLMERLRISEGEAYARIRRQSMNKGASLAEIARAVILLYRDRD